MTNARIHAIIEGALSEGRSVLLENESKEICGCLGMNVPCSKVVKSEDEASKEALELGFPLVAKLISPDILHKSDVGGVITKISEVGQVVQAYRQLCQAAQKNCPSAKIDGVLLEKMEPPGIEVIVGSTRDPQFGKVVMFGLGGIFVETYSDVAFRLVPVTKLEAREMIEELRAYPILKGSRGRPGVNLEIIEDLISNVSKMVQELDRIEQMDLNPVILRENQASVVDAKIMLGEGSKPHQSNLPVSSLNGFFKARSVAVVGASTTPGKIGHEIFRNLTQYGYAGQVFPVNPSAESVLEVKCHPNVSSIPEAPDLAVLAVSAKSIPSILEECGKKGVRNAVIVSGGFKEVGEESAELERKAVSIARGYGIRLVGPNCIGVLDMHSNLDSLFQPHERMMRPPLGNVAFITQSGTVGCTMLEWMAEQSIGVSKFVSYGNRSDVDEGDLVEFFGADNETGVIAIYVEGLSHGRKLFDAARRVSKTKPVVILKAGATRLGSTAARSHTGTLGGPQRVALAAFKQAGMIVAHDVEQLLDIVKSLVKQPLPKSDGIVMVTNGAGPVVMAADKFEDLGLKIAKLAPETVKELETRLPPYCYVTETTIDLTGSATSKDYDTALRIAANDSSVGLLMPFFVFVDPPLDEGIISVMQDLQKLNKPLLCCAAGGAYTRKQILSLERSGIPVFETGERIAVAAHALFMRRRLTGR